MTSGSVSRSPSRRAALLVAAGLTAALAVVGAGALVADDPQAPAVASTEQVRAAADAVRRETVAAPAPAPVSTPVSTPAPFEDPAAARTSLPLTAGAGSVAAVATPASMLPPPVIDAGADADPQPGADSRADADADADQRPASEPPAPAAPGAAQAPMIVALAAGEAPAPAATDAASEPSDAEAALGALLAGLDRFHARFTQSLQDGRGNQLRRASGELWAERPDRFRWEISAPFAELLVGDGRMLWLWDPDLEQVTVRPYDDRLRGTPALLLSGDPAELIAGFEVDLVSAAGRRSVWLLTPRSGDGLFDRLEMVFMDDLPQTLVIHDGMGQRTEVVFEDARADFEPAPGRFSFVIPDGADVLREDAENAEPAPAPPSLERRP